MDPGAWHLMDPGAWHLMDRAYPAGAWHLVNRQQNRELRPHTDAGIVRSIVVTGAFTRETKTRDIMPRLSPAIACLLTVLVGQLFGSQAVSAEPTASGQFLDFKYDQVERKYLLHLPQDLPENAPLVFVLHGYHGDARDYMGELGMNRVADANGFAVCYPQGTRDFEGTPHWNARLTISKADDIGFLATLAADLQKRHKLDPAKTFTCGISNGGFMSYTLVAEKPGVFKAAASVIDTMSGYTWQHRETIRPVPILQISGLDDKIVPYDGSMSAGGGWGGAPHRDAVIDFWAKLDQTKTEDVVQISDKTTVHYFKDGVDGKEVWHYKIKGFGHGVPRKQETGIDTVEEIWKFFSKF